MMVRNVTGKTNVPQIWDYNLVSIDHMVLIDRWSTWVYSLDCLFVIYKLSKLTFRFLKTSSRTEVINKGVLLNWMAVSIGNHMISSAISNKQARVNFSKTNKSVRARRARKCLFIPNCTRKIMWLLINNIREKHNYNKKFWQGPRF